MSMEPQAPVPVAPTELPAPDPGAPCTAVDAPESAADEAADRSAPAPLTPLPPPDAAVDAADPDTDRLFPWLRENFEAVVVAFIMALVIRCFCLEVFIIPTGSMQPTLMGHPDTGDRIMVNKFLLNFTPVHRFDVIVFKYPLDNSRNFVKRIVGIGPEILKIKDGDIYVRREGQTRFAVARKPLEVQERLWIDHYEGRFETEDVLAHWALTHDEYWSLGNGAFRIDGTKAPDHEQVLQYLRPVNDHYRGGSNRNGGENLVGDVKVSVSGVVESGAGGVVLRLYNEPYFFEVLVQVGGGSQVTFRNDFASGGAQVTPIPDLGLEIGKPWRLAAMVFDGSLYVTRDDRPVFRLDFITDEDLACDTTGTDKHIALGARDAALNITRIVIQRDLYYTSPQGGVLERESPLEIPAGCYFAVGDNCPNSKDSRLWRRRWVRLDTGEVIAGDAEGESDQRNFVSEPGDLKMIKDVYGVVHHVPESAIVEDETEYHKFVREEELVGKAFLVWWPLSRAKIVR